MNHNQQERSSQVDISKQLKLKQILVNKIILSEKKLKILLLIIALFLGLELCYLWINRGIYFQKDLAKNVPMPIAIQPTINQIVKARATPRAMFVAPTAILPDFSNESIKPRTQFDISLWKTYENSEVGFKFKYPPEWGTPKEYIDKCKPLSLCSSDGKDTTAFFISFPNSGFGINGESKNYSPHRGGGPMEFTGLADPSEVYCEHDYYIRNAIHLFCQQVNERINYFSAIKTGYGSYPGYRVLLIDLPNNKTVNGLAFGGSVIAKDKWKMYPYSAVVSDINGETIGDILGKAILSRKADAETMKTFDVYEKVFETIQIF